MRTRHDAQMVAAISLSPQGGTPAGTPALQAPRGVALILVMLAMLVLSVLAATIVFTARAETFASTNYKLDTQADYLAKAGIQRAINWFRSTHYQPVPQTAAATYYDVTSTGPPYNLYISNTSPVRTCASPPCLAFNRTVQLIGFGSGSSQYPDIFNAEATPRRVPVAFASDLNDSTYTNNRISGDSTNSGYYLVNATLLDYETVNAVYKPPATAPSSCVATTLPDTYTCPMETWEITSRAVWTGSSSSTSRAATAEEVAIVQPVYWPTWGNALYGYCGVTMSGTSGVCTDGYNSHLGTYAGGNISVAAGACGQTTSTNVIASGAGVGSNGYVDLTNSNVTVGGNVTLGSSPVGGSSCCTDTSNPQCGFNGSASSVSGEVINGPYVEPQPVPSFPTGYPGSGPTGAPSITTSATLPNEDTAMWSTLVTTSWPYTKPGGLAPDVPASTTDCISTAACQGTKPDSTNAQGPYLVDAIKLSGSENLNLVGGMSPLTPVYYDVGCISMAGSSTLTISGYVVLNVLGDNACGGSSGLDLEGNGVANGVSSPGAPPVALTINYKGTSPVKIGGNGAASLVLSAPNASVSAGGCGANGYIAGSIEALNVTLSGGCPMHYDVSLSRVGGNLGTMISTAYGRKKM